MKNSLFKSIFFLVISVCFVTQTQAMDDIPKKDYQPVLCVSSLSSDTPEYNSRFDEPTRPGRASSDPRDRARSSRLKSKHSSRAGANGSSKPNSQKSSPASSRASSPARTAIAGTLPVLVKSNSNPDQKENQPNPRAGVDGLSKLNSQNSSPASSRSSLHVGSRSRSRSSSPTRTQRTVAGSFPVLVPAAKPTPKMNNSKQTTTHQRRLSIVITASHNVSTSEEASSEIDDRYLAPTNFPSQKPREEEDYAGDAFEEEDIFESVRSLVTSPQNTSSGDQKDAEAPQEIEEDIPSEMRFALIKELSEACQQENLEKVKKIVWGDLVKILYHADIKRQSQLCSNKNIKAELDAYLETILQ